ncbi:hypothetical protein KW837_26705 [Pseudomonas sp. PDM24]|uniref:hypothetical protein n=1 Tax=Pseudomonas sp. PDM24 TaxID=2854777 RepID=UPI001C484D1B|nr:hypothetical protein [Pseudomonas sp. PDM24]MBV7497864.1 hypothetical protein [Pseudomonas sp. PDM24]
MKNITTFLFAVGLFFNLTATFAQDQGKSTEIQNLNSKSVEIKKENPKEQIPTDISTKDAAGRQNVSMQCFTTDNNHRVMITVQNQNTSSRSCHSYCFYSTNGGYNGTQNCNGSIRPGYSGEFCSLYTSNVTYTITDPGAFDCER